MARVTVPDGAVPLAAGLAASAGLAGAAAGGAGGAAGAGLLSAGFAAVLSVGFAAGAEVAGGASLAAGAGGAALGPHAPNNRTVTIDMMVSRIRLRCILRVIFDLLAARIDEPPVAE